MSENQNYFQIGHIANPLDIKIENVSPKGKSCNIVIPARVNTFLCHHDYFVNPPKPRIYPVNSINFAVAKFTEATVELRNDKEIHINASENHSAIIEHAVRIMQKTLGINIGFNIEAKNLHNISHGGLASSSAIMSAVAQAINILMGNALSVNEITKLLSQNYGEETSETSKKGFISNAASIGGSTAVGSSGKSLVIVGGESEIWCLDDLPKEYCAILLYPKKIKVISKAMDNALNKKELLLLENVDDGWGEIKENMLKVKIIPSINKKDYSVLFRAINMYTIGAFGNIPKYFGFRWTSQGVPFESIIYDIFSKLFGTLKIEENCFFVSSNGPLIAIITKYPKRVSALLKGFNRNFIIEKVALCNGIKYKLK